MLRVILLCLTLFALPVFAKQTKIVLTSSNMVSINYQIDEEATSKAGFEIFTKCLANPGKDIFLVLYTPGGSVTAGMNFIDFVKSLDCKVNTITIFAASMGYQIVENFHKRYMIPSGILMSHRASLSGLSGQIPGELESRMNFYKDFLGQLDESAAERVGITVAEYQKKVYDELWMPSRTAVRTNHADEIANVSCDKSLAGSDVVEIKVLFWSFKVELAKCPLIIGPISVKQDTAGKASTYFNPMMIKEIWLP